MVRSSPALASQLRAVTNVGSTDSDTPIQAAPVDLCCPFDRATDPALSAISIRVGERHVERRTRRRCAERTDLECDCVVRIEGIEDDQEVDVAVAVIVSTSDRPVQPHCCRIELRREVQTTTSVHSASRRPSQTAWPSSTDYVLDTKTMVGRSIRRGRPWNHAPHRPAILSAHRVGQRTMQQAMRERDGAHGERAGQSVGTEPIRTTRLRAEMASELVFHWSRVRGSNSPPHDYKSSALPTELTRQGRLRIPSHLERRCLSRGLPSRRTGRSTPGDTTGSWAARSAASTRRAKSSRRRSGVTLRGCRWRTCS
jgi:hypothetical protein